MRDPRTFTHAQLVSIVADVQAILWQESRMLPDDPRQYGEYWNPAKEWESQTVEEIADVLDAADLKRCRLPARHVRRLRGNAGWRMGAEGREVLRF
jgi:hypothetical protein